MRNLTLRVIVWFVAVPTLIAVILLLPHARNLALNVIVVGASALGAREFAQLFERKETGYRSSALVVPLLGAVLPLIALLVLNRLLPPGSFLFALYLLCAVVFAVQVFRHNPDDFRYTLNNTAANVALLLYPGLFMSYLVRLSEYPHSQAIILAFFGMVFFNDTMAYIAGRLYRFAMERCARASGREWQPVHVFPVSPKKTIVGFVGGLALSPVTLLLARAVAPEAFPFTVGVAVLIGSAVGLSVILGDLIESALKRSAISKDSGSLIPGRGGMLDSIDSILYAAPVFYYLLTWVL